MSVFATIYNTDFEPLTDGVEVADDAEFSALEARAGELAATGTKCCIRWSRDSDGQVAYWGPRGATLKPHWYSKPGRPEEMQGGKRRNVYLDDASWAKANALGNGNASDGIRIAVARGGMGVVAHCLGRNKTGYPVHPLYQPLTQVHKVLPGEGG